jgi:hypothetical protein
MAGFWTDAVLASIAARIEYEREPPQTWYDQKSEDEYALRVDPITGDGIGGWII